VRRLALLAALAAAGRQDLHFAFDAPDGGGPELR
jgi:hypothetical protein